MHYQRRLPFVVSLLAIAWLASSTLWSQEPPPAVAPAQAEKKDDAADAPKLREQTIYIPYTKLREVFETEGRGVFLPYEKFAELWKAAREKTVPAAEGRPPVDAIITEVENEATVEKDVVRVAAKVKIELLAEGWIEVPLRLSDAAILSAKIGDAPARIVAQSDGSYRLLVEKKGKESAQVELLLEYAKAFAKSPGQNSVSFDAPQAPVNRWRIRIPESGVKVNIHPLIAATEAPADAKPEDPAKETVVLAFVGAAPTVRIDWTPKSEGAAGLAALANVQAQQTVTIDEGVVRTRTLLAYDISRAELSQLLVEVPADHKVVNVFDPNVRQWEVEQQGEVQKITVHLFEPTRGAQNITVELERFSDDITKGDVKVPVVRALGVGRQQGVVVVGVATALRAETTARTGLLQLDAGELPRALASTPWAFSYRYAALPFDLALSVEKVQPRIQADELVEAYLEPEQLTLDLLVLYNIERAGVFQLELDVPAGYEVRQVRGRGAAGSEAAVVDTHHLEGENKTHLLVNLSRKAFGRVALMVELQKRLDDPNLLSPTGKASEIAVELPRVTPSSVERSTGRLVVFAPESLRLNPTKQDGLRNVSFAEAYENAESCRGGRFSAAREVLAFAYTQEPVSLVLTAERRKPQITVRQLLVGRIEAGVVKYDATFFYDIRYSGVKSLRIDVPQELAGEIRNQTTAVRETTIDPPPPDVAAGYVAWSLTGETELLGQHTIRLAWEKKMDELKVGKSVDLVVPHLRPMAVDRAWGQIVVTKAETMEVLPSGEPTGLRPIDPQHDVMDGASVADAARAFEFHEDWSLKLTATRYQLEEVKRTSIERAVLRAVVTRSNEITVQALYRMRSVRQRLAVELPANYEPDSNPLQINGRRVALEHGDKKELYVPLVGHGADEPFLLELRYTVPGSHSRLDFPTFPDDPAIQQVHLQVYLPSELALLGKRGPWTEDYTWRWRTFFSLAPVPQMDDRTLISQLMEGIDVTGDPASSFPTGGTLYSYSTLRPAAPPDGSLRLVAFDEQWLTFFVVASIAILGLVLVRQTLSQQLFAMALLIAALVLCGVFLHTFSLQIIDAALMLSIFVVVLLWLTLHLTRYMQHVSLMRPVAAVAAPSQPAASGQSPFSSSSAAQPRQADTGQPPGGGAPKRDDADGPSSGSASEGGPSDAK
jgi:hypothetical protein